MTETLTFQQGRTYIVKRTELKFPFHKIKVLVLTDTTITVQWEGGFNQTIDLQKFRFEYKIVEEVG